MAQNNDNNRSPKDFDDNKKQDENKEDGPKAAHRTRQDDLMDEEDLDDEFNFDIQER